jgi:hypothetical protein
MKKNVRCPPPRTPHSTTYLLLKKLEVLSALWVRAHAHTHTHILLSHTVTTVPQAKAVEAWELSETHSTTQRNNNKNVIK